MSAIHRLSIDRPSTSKVAAFRSRSMLRSQWGILFAILAFFATTLLSLQQLPALTTAKSYEGDAATSATSPIQTERQAVQEVATVQGRIAQLDFEDIDFNRGWRKGKSGWIRIQQYRVDEPIELNFVQKISPVFWGVLLWMFTIILLVLSS